MRIITSTAELRDALGSTGPTSLVPTMGNLHKGHVSLVRIAQGQGLPTVVSLFVNRLQFGPAEDFDQYPRTLERDCELLEEIGCDVVFAPAEADLYPEPQRFTVQPDTRLADTLEGVFRPGFFNGVCTVVLKLFNIVQPKVAVFGKKDYQQLLIIKEMTRQLSLPIKVIAGETSREGDGLALSSRNGYLNAEERSRAPLLGQVLLEVVERTAEPTADYRALEAFAMRRLFESGWAPDYVALRRRVDLRPADAGVDQPGDLIVLAAARLGGTRLIDNMEC